MLWDVSSATTVRVATRSFSWHMVRGGGLIVFAAAVVHRALEKDCARASAEYPRGVSD